MSGCLETCGQLTASLPYTKEQVATSCLQNIPATLTFNNEVVVNEHSELSNDSSLLDHDRCHACTVLSLGRFVT